MARTNIKIGLTGTDVLVPGSFITEHMSGASGDHVKVFLLLLRSAQEGRPFDTALAADILETTEKDVERSVRFWEKKGLISPSKADTYAPAAHEYAVEEDDISEAAEETDRAVSAPQAPAKEKDEDRYKVILTPEVMAEVEKDPQFKELTHILQAYSNKVVSHSDYEHLIRFYYRMNKKLEICDTILAHCADKKKLTMKNVDKISIEILDKGCTSIDDVRYYLDRTAIGSEIIDVMGLNMKKLSGAHQDEVDKWFLEYGSPRELVIEACRRGVKRSGSPDCMPLIDSILKDWSDRGITTMEAVEARDKAHKEEQGKKYARKSAPGSAGEDSSNKFNRFSQRDTDFSADEAVFMSRHRKKKTEDEAADDPENGSRT